MKIHVASASSSNNFEGRCEQLNTGKFRFDEKFLFPLGTLHAEHANGDGVLKPSMADAGLNDFGIRNAVHSTKLGDKIGKFGTVWPKDFCVRRTEAGECE